jgi:hypothetical protein
VTATPGSQLDNLDRGTGLRYPTVHACCRGASDVPRTVTQEQVDLAVAQLRERPGRAAAEQVQAVLRALDLAVVPGNASVRH